MGKTNYKSNGFTIVELLVVIVIIGILASISIVSYVGIQDKAMFAVVQSDLSHAATQLELDKVSTETYPASAALANSGNGLKSSNGVTFKYSYDSGANGYCLSATNTTGKTYYITSSNKTPTLGECPSPKVIALGGTGEEYFNSATITSDGGYIVPGSTMSFGAGSMDILISKYSSSGNLSWAKTWGGSGDESSYSIAQTSDNGYVIAGFTTSFGAGGGDMVVFKLDQNGNTVWSNLWGGTGSDDATSVAVLDDGSVIAVGSTASFGAGLSDMVVVKYNSDGTFAWNKTFGGTGNEYGKKVVKTSAGGFSILGTTASYGAGQTDIFLSRFDSSGALLAHSFWGSTLAETLTGFDGMIQSSDGGYVIVGVTGSFGAVLQDAFIVKINSALNAVEWSRMWGGASTDQAASIAQDSDSGFVIAANTFSFGAGSNDHVLLKYQSDGTFVWNKTWGGTLYDTAYFIRKTSSGFIAGGAGVSYGKGNYDGYLLKYDSNGNISSCSSPMCQSPTATKSSISGTFVVSGSMTQNSPTATKSSSPAAVISSQNLTQTNIIEN